jgi:ATP-dependent Clp protease ATP-binding subunit ClpC
MLTLHALRRLATEAFPGQHPRLVHLLYAWATKDPDGELSELLDGTGISTERMATALAPLVASQADDDMDILRSAILEVSQEAVLGEHLLRALCDAPAHRISRALAAAGLDLQRLARRLNVKKRPPEGVLARHGITVDLQASPLLQYGRDLTALAAQGTFDDLCERPEDASRLVEVLLRRRKANPVLTGPAGVGKTALVELLARMVVHAQVSGLEPGLRFYELSMGKVVAGTKYRGDFEQRMEKVIEAFLASQPAILFIDEVHLLWGAGRAEGAPMDAGNLLKPLLGRGTVRVIGATTVEEYQQYIARDEALARRFQEVRLNEPDARLTARMVRKQADALTEHHAVLISDTMVGQAIELTNRHLSNRWQPDKSVDLLDSAAVSVRREGRGELTVVDLLATLARQTGRPIAALTGDDRASLRNLSEGLKRHVLGQDHAVARVAATLIQHRQDLGPSERNLGTFLFAGDTGVGKTELARAIAAVFFGSDKLLLHLDMAEYGESGTVNKLIGAPPGFVGSEKEGTLIAWLHLHGSGVVLFDEIDKAHPDVHRLLLGMLDNGRIRTPRGESVDTRQCVVVLTTNAITAAAMERGAMGFKREQNAADPTDLLADAFPREFLGRFDEIILFNRLGPTQMRQVLKLRLDEAIARFRRRQIDVVFDENRLMEHLLAGLRELRTGARGIARLLERNLIQPIAAAMLNSDAQGSMEVELGDDFYREGAVTVGDRSQDSGIAETGE